MQSELLPDHIQAHHAGLPGSDESQQGRGEGERKSGGNRGQYPDLQEQSGGRRRFQKKEVFVFWTHWISSRGSEESINASGIQTSQQSFII